MLLCIRLLHPPDVGHSPLLYHALWALSVCNVRKTSLVIRVLTQKVHCRQVQRSSACAAFCSLKDSGRRLQLLYFPSFLLGFLSVTLDLSLIFLSLFAFCFDAAANVVFDHPDGRNRRLGECLHNLKRRQQILLVNVVQYFKQFWCCRRQPTRGRREV